MKHSFNALKFEFRKLFGSRTLLIFALVAFLLLLGVSVIWGTLVKQYSAESYNPTATLSEEETASYLKLAKENYNAYLLSKGETLSPSDSDESAWLYNPDIGSAYYSEQRFYYEALAAHKQDAEYAVTTKISAKNEAISNEQTATYRLVRYAFAASVCMILVGLFVGAYAFGNDKSSGNMKNLLASGTQRVHIFGGQFLLNAVLILLFWIVFIAVGLIAFGRGATASVYNLFHTRCAVTSAMGFYFGKMAFALVGAFLASACSAFITSLTRYTGLYFLGAPALSLLGVGILLTLLRTTDCLSLAATKAPLVGIALLPVVPAFSIITSLILQCLLAAGLFALNYARLKKTDL